MNKTLLGKTGLNVSKIGLGTVEIGIPYGIGPVSLPSEQEAITILKTAVEMGITYIDTARGYGLAEERIGKSNITRNPNVVIGTKCGQFLKNEPTLSPSELEQRIREEIDMSRKNLGQEVLQLVQFHNELEDYTDFSAIIEIFQKLQDEQKILHAGVAIRGEAAALAALNTGFFETMQVAYSIADQRMAQAVLPQAQTANVGIINRSVLLKGALTNARKKLHPSLAALREISDKAAAIAQQTGMDLPTLALRFAISNPAVSTVLIGTTKPHHLQSAIEAANTGQLAPDILQELLPLAISDTNQIDPAKWPKVD